jgi:hypothetical protein
MTVTEILERFDELLEQSEKGKTITVLQLKVLRNATCDFGIEQLEKKMSLRDDIAELRGEKPSRIKWVPRDSIKRRRADENDLIAIRKRHGRPGKRVRGGFSLVKNTAPSLSSDCLTNEFRAFLQQVRRGEKDLHVDA